MRGSSQERIHFSRPDRVTGRNPWDLDLPDLFRRLRRRFGLIELN
jgi:hypothetical protein